MTFLLQALRVASLVKNFVTTFITSDSSSTAAESQVTVHESRLLADIDSIDRQDLLDIWNWNSTVPETVNVLVHDIFTETAQRQPDAPAVCAWDGDWTYAELDEISTRLANYLIDKGVKPDIIVPLCFEKSRWTPVAQMAVMKAGGASLAMDAAQPVERLRTIVQQVDPVVILSSFSAAEVASQLTERPVVVVDNEHMADLSWRPMPRTKVQPWHKLYVVFTSGSTGTPKGAIITHANFSSAIRYQQIGMGFTSSSRVYDFVKYAFDISWSNVLHTLTAGGCLCIPSDSEALNDLAGSFRRYNANFLDVNPSVASTLQPSEMASLKHLQFGGEFLSGHMASEWAKHCETLNTYGPAECSIRATFVPMSENTGATPSIGSGIGLNTWLVSVSDHDQLVAIGNVGELLLEGPLVGDGYLGDAEKTAAAYITDPKWLVRGAPGYPGRHGRLYKSGDLVRYNTDGSLTFVARKDSQVKINGQRVELGDVEYHVQANVADGVEVEAVADVITPRESSKSILVAFLHIKDRLAIEANGLQAEMKRVTAGLEDRLSKRVPAYMIPYAYIPVKDLPKTATGKLNRRQLRTMASSMTLEELMALNMPGGVRRALTSDTERQLQSIWSSLLRISADKIGAEDSFLRIGGDSIGAMRLVGEARKQGLYITVADVFKNPRLSDLAAVIRKLPSAATETIPPYSLLKASINVQAARDEIASLCDIDATQIEDIFPCTPLQEGLLALTARRSGDYIARYVFELRPSVNIDQFEAAWHEVIRTTPILRTRIADLTEQGLVQVIINGQTSSSFSKKSNSLAAYHDADETLPMGLGTPLARLGFVHENHNEPDKRFFVWTIHHALYDGWSMPQMLEKLERAYRGEEPLLHEPPFQLFVKHIMDIDSDSSSKYWKAQFDGSEAANIFPSLPSATYQPRSDTLTLHPIRDLAWPNTDITPSTIVRAAWSILSALYVDSTDVVFGVTVTGRQAAVPGVDQMTGPTLATVPVQVALDWHESVEQLLQRLQSQAIDMTAFEQTGLQRIRRVSAKAKQACEFQTLLLMQPAERNDNEEAHQLFVDENEGQSQDSKDSFAEFDTHAITIECRLQRDGLQLQVGFDSHVIGEQQIKKLVLQLDHIIRQICHSSGDGEIKVADLKALGRHDVDEIWGWNATVPETVEKTVHRLIEDTASTWPDSPAVCSWDGDWTYAELNDVSSRLACHLVSLGVGRGTVVPLCFEKSRWVPVAMLAVMKAGGASVALDPTLPEDRLLSIVRQIKPLLTVSSPANGKLAGKLAPDQSIVILDDKQLAQLPQPVQEILPLVQPWDKLYIVFTSGTTGTPKGVVITHSNFSSALKHQHGAHGFNEHSRVFDFASYAFDVAWSNALCALECGACLCIPSDTERKDDLAGAMQRLRVTHAELTPSTASILPPATLKALHTLILGGEKVSAEQAKVWAQLVHLKNSYGPCECTPTSTVSCVDPDTTMIASSIGRGIGVNTWLADTVSAESLVPVGAIGELLLEGPLVGPGYLDDPAKTAEAFVEDPSWLLGGGGPDHPGRRGRLYKTGDLARYNTDGSLTFVGRKDAQVKINGQRVELGEIESRISLESWIRQSACILPTSGPCINRLVGVIAIVGPERESRGISPIKLDARSQDEQTQQRVEALRALLENTLPAYMVPTLWVVVHDIPLSASGKLDRKRLGEWLANIDAETFSTISGIGRSPGHRKPKNEAEEVLLRACSTVLNTPMENIDLQRSFVANGGDSISAMRLSPQCRAANVVFSVANLLKGRSLAEVAQLSTTVTSPAVSRTEKFDVFFDLSPIQQWFFGQSPPDLVNMKSHYCNQSFYVRVARPISPDTLRSAIDTVVEKHSMLRARFARVEGKWMQRVVKPGQGLYHLESSQQDSMVDIECLAAKRQQELDIENGPVFSADVCITPAPKSDQYLILIAHHLVVDLVSWRIILEDLEVLLTGGALQEEVPFQVWNHLQIEKAGTPELDPENVLNIDKVTNNLAFWEFTPDTPNTVGDLKDRSLVIGRDLTLRLLKDANSAFNTEPVDLLLSAVWHSFLQAFPSRGDLTIFNEGHGREPGSLEVDLSRTVGWFTTMSPLRISRDEADSAVNIVRHVKDMRRRLPSNGWAYFASRYLNSKGIRAFESHEATTMELLDDLHSHVIPEIESANNTTVEDIFPCLPMVDGMLLSQIKEPGAYETSALYEIRSPIGHLIRLDRLAEAWQTVIARQPALRTVFIPASDSTAAFNQVVLQSYRGDVILLESENRTSALAMLNNLQPVNYRKIRPPHRLAMSFVREENLVFCQLEASHTITDGASSAIIVEDWIKAYTGTLDLDGINDVNRGFARFLKSVSATDRMAYWKRKLADAEPCYFEPLNHVPHVSQAEQGVCFASAEITGDKFTQILRFCESQSVTPASLFQSAWALCLAAYTGKDSVKFGYLASGRDLPVSGITEAVGAYASMLICRADISREWTSPQLFDIGVSFSISDTTAYLSLDARSSCLSSEQASRVISLVKTISITIATDGMLNGSLDGGHKSTTLSDISSVSEEDLDAIWRWNKTVPEAANVLVHELIAETIAKQPNAPAVCAWDGDFTYSELDDASSRLAFHLIGLGVGPEVIVPLCLEKSRWMPVAMLAVMKAGGASVAMDVTVPKERLQTIVQQIEPSLILSSSATKDLATQLTNQPIVVLDSAKLSELDLPSKPLSSRVQPGNTLYINFTSGSTGQPKGVIIKHVNFSSSIRHVRDLHGFKPTSRVYDFSSHAFDNIWSNALQTLSCGACLCIPSETDRRNDLAGSIKRLGANFIDITPSTASILPLETIKYLDLLMVGGERLIPDSAKQWASVVDLRNGYGPCECTPTTTIAAIRPNSYDMTTIGRGVGVNTWVVDAHTGASLVPVGSIGELLLEGPLVGAGYLGDPQKTANVFIEDPKWLLQGTVDRKGRHGRLYKTGDLVRYNPDGTLSFVGRKDAQVKINGQRLELGDIEHHVASSITDSADAQVIVEMLVPRQHHQVMLIAFICLSGAAGKDANEQASDLQRLTVGLNERLAKLIPPYMIPSSYVLVDHVPMTATGKTDRRQIRAMGERMTLEELLIHSSSTSGERRKPTTEMERRLLSLSSSVLGVNVDKIGIDDSFLQVGGDSIGAMKLVAAAREQGIALTVADIFQTPRLGDLAAKARRVFESDRMDVEPFSLLKTGYELQEIRQEAAAFCGVDASHVEDVFPCTPLQEGLLALTTKRPGDYIFRSIHQLQRTVDVQRFREAWQHLVSITPMLRTRIVDLSSQGLVQVVIAEQPIYWLGENYTSLGAYQRADEQLTIGLGTPLVRVAIIKEQDKHFFVWTMHHALYDGWTVPLLLENLEKSYIGEANLQHPPPFQLFVRHLQRADSKQAEEYWKKQFTEFDAVTYPALPSSTYEPQSDQTIDHHIQELQWPTTDSTTSTAVRVAWSILAARYTDSNDVIFGLTVSGRQASVPGIERVTGPTIATVPMRVVLNPGKTLQETLMQIQAQGIEMTAFEQTGLQRIRRMSTEAERACNFQTLLVIQPSESSDNSSSRLFELRDEDGDEPIADLNTHALTVSCDLEDHGLALRIDFDSKIISKNQVQKHVAHFEHVLRQICDPENAQKTLADIETLGREDLHDIWGWNATVPECSNALVHRLFEDTAQRLPDIEAVCAWDGTWTYSELDSITSRLARHLVSLGVGPEVVVPLCFEKSGYTCIAMLAVMKAGGASVAMDTTLPEDRLRIITRQVNPTLILSSSSNEDLALRLADTPVMVVNEASLSSLADVNAPSSTRFQRVRPWNKLYVVFTSGSTGTPKGVIITHSNYSNAIQHQQGINGFKEGSRVYDFASYAFDATWANLLNSLTSGATLCVPSDAERRDDLAGSLQHYRANFVQLTPSTASILSLESIQLLDTLLLAGEALPQAYAERWAKIVDLRNAYGPCEATPAATFASIKSDNMLEVGIGKGVGTVTWVADTKTAQFLTPVGSVGELLLEGPSVGPGYLDDPEKTAAAFIDNPPWLLRGAPGQPGRHGRLYRTGDLVRYNRDGSLVYIGRKDAQVKLHGQRVELGEIDNHMMRHSSVRQAASVFPVSGPCANRLVGVVSLEECQPGAVNSSEINLAIDDEKAARQFRDIQKDLHTMLEGALPVYMVPSIWIAVREIPLNPSGKLNHKVLREWLCNMDLETFTKISHENDTDDEVNRKPVTHAEQVIANACSIVLNLPVEQINIHKSFIANGGDSISAMRLSPHCRASQVVFSVATLLRSKSLAEVARNSAVTATLTAHQEEYERSFGLSPIQQWFFDQCPTQLVNTTDYHFNQSFYLQLRQVVSADRIESAISTIVRQHSMLRARFQQMGEYWTQSVLKPNAENVHQFKSWNLESLSEVRAVASQRQLGLDIEKGVVFAADLCTLPSGEQYLLFVAHHLVVDLVSWRIILEDLETLISDGQLEEGLPFQVWNQLQKEEIADSKYDPQRLPSVQEANNDLEFWNFDSSTSNTASDQYEDVLEIGPEVTALLLKESNSAFNTEPLDLLLSAVSDAFLTIFPRQDLTIFNEGHGRESWNAEVDLSRTVGWFSTLAPITVSRDRDNSYEHIVRLVKDARRRLLANGWAYFTSRYLSSKGAHAFKSHGSTMELLKDTSSYKTSQVYRIQSPDNDISIARLAEAWQKVVARHPSLRSVFIDGFNDDTAFNQVVLEACPANIVLLKSHSENSALSMLTGLPSVNYQQLKPPHRLTLLELPNINGLSGSQVICQLEMSHAITDGSSSMIILEDWARAYAGVLSQEAVDINYDFARVLTSSLPANRMNYWKKKLGGVNSCQFPHLSSLSRQANDVSSVSIDITGETFAKIQQFSEEKFVTAASLFQSAWALLLANYTGTNDVCFGYLASGRDLPVPGIAESVGAYANLLVCRIDLSQNRTKDDLVRNTHDQVLSDLDFQHCSLADIQHELSLLPGQALFNTLYDIALSITYGAGQIGLNLEYRLCCLSDEQANRVAFLLERLVAALVSNEDQGTGNQNNSLADIDVMTQSDLQDVWKWNAVVPQTIDAVIHNLVTDSAQRWPDKQAVCAWDGDWTYRELDKASTSFGHCLRSFGIGPDVIVPLYFEKSRWTVVAMVAVLKAGAAFVLVDPSQPTSRLNSIIQQTQAKLLVCSSTEAYRCSDLGIKVLTVDSPHPDTMGNTDRPLQVESNPSSPMYVVFTSGSTGKPKGVVVTHASFASAIYYQANALGYDSQARVYDFASYVFDASIETAFMTLATGGCLCVPSDADRKNNLTESLINTKATLIELTPSVARTLERQRLVVLRFLILGGEAVNQDDAKGWPDNVLVINTYGPSECTPTSTIQCQHDGVGVMNIGAGAGAVTWLSDPSNSDRLVPIGAVGELLLEGPLVGPGYLHDAERTAEAFIEDPVWLRRGTADLPGRRGRLYKTGDLVRYNDDGSLSFVGRKDTQVKIRGQRVELGEVEHQLQVCMPGVQQVAAEVLPSYMVPAALLELDQLPMTASGKTDRRRLRDIGAGFSVQQLAELRSGLVADKRGPSTEMERALQQIWAQILNVDAATIGMDDSFLRLGGDSITAMQISAAARASVAKISITDILQKKTIAKIASAAAHLTTREEFVDDSTQVQYSTQKEVVEFQQKHGLRLGAVLAEDIEDIYPCTPMQERILQAQEQDPRAYVTGFGLAIEASQVGETVEFSRIQRAWANVVKRHGLLRAVLVRDEPGHGRTTHVILRGPAPSISFHTTSEAEAAATGHEDLQRPPYYAQNGLQHHLSVYQTTAKRAYLRFEMNHAIIDGHSTAILLRDFELAYTGHLYSDGPLYSNFIKYVREQPQDDAHGFWAKHLHDVEPCLFPTSQNVAEQQGTVQIEVPNLDPKGIATFCANWEVTQANLIRIAWALVLQKYTKSTTPCFGTITSGRDLPVHDVDEIFGPLMSLIPCRIRLDETRSVLETLKASQEEYLHMLPHQTSYLANIQKHAKDLESELFNTAISIHRDTLDGPETQNPQGHSIHLQDEFDPVHYDIYIRGTYGNDDLSLVLEFWEERISRSQGVDVAESFSAAISSVISQPELDIRQLTIM
ncbi:Nonribosomal peptide synthetase dtxS1 [Metarhizium anisopliae]